MAARGARGSGAAALGRRIARAGLSVAPAPVQRAVRLRVRDARSRAVPLHRLDAELDEAARRFAASEDDARSFLAGIRLAVPPGRPADPFSEPYRRWVWDVYAAVSGRATYEVANEVSTFDLQAAIARPFPFATGSAAVVGDDLVARGCAVRALDVAVPARIVEFGAGWGNLTADLVLMGHRVTAVEVDAGHAALLRARCPGADVVQAAMLEYEAPDPFDAAVFYESFHHCADHLAMLGRLQDIVRPAGRVVFCAEPVDDLPFPWGLRLDGLSLWSTRRFGWLELGFDRRYFHLALARTGWRVGTRPGPTPGAPVYVARPATLRA